MEPQAGKPRIHLYLDDIRPCPPGFVAARSAEECILLLQECDVDILSLDFDLGWTYPTGLEVAKAIVAKPTEIRFPKEIYLHSSSAIGRMQMYNQLYPNKPADTILVNGVMPADILQRAAMSKIQVEKPEQ